MAPLVEIVILNWNGSVDTLRCIASLERQTYPNFSITLVDNGSTDGSLEAFAGLGERVTILPLGRNTGYTGGNNTAMRRAFAGSAAYVWLFNNDATAKPDTLAKLVAECEADPTIGLASPLILEEEACRSIQSGCGLFDLAIPSYAPAHDRAEAAHWLRDFPARIALHGTALLVRRGLYQAIGGLEDRFFAYWEDIEYSIRGAAAGFRNIVVLDTAIHHSSKQTMNSPASVKPHYYYFMARNELLMWRKLVSGTKFAKAASWVLRRQLRQIRLMPGYEAGIDAILAGLWHGMRGVGGAYDPTRRMPPPLRGLLGKHPLLLARLLGETGARSSP